MFTAAFQSASQAPGRAVVGGAVIASMQMQARPSCRARERRCARVARTDGGGGHA